MPCGSLTTFKYKHINYTAKTLCNYCFNVHTSDLALKVKHIHKQTLKKKAYGLNAKQWYIQCLLESKMNILQPRSRQTKNKKVNSKYKQ